MTNFDAQEVNKFSELSADWWEPQGAFKTLHEINPLRLQFIQSYMSLNNAKVIDVGCGGGILTEALAQAGAIATGIDMSDAAIKKAQQHWQQSTLAQQRPNAINYQQISTEEIAEQHPGAFDALTCMEMLEHVPDPVSIIQACAKLVKPGGHLFFSTLNRNPKSYLLAIVGAEYLLKLIPKGTHDFAKFIKPSEFTAWARQAGLNPQNFKGLHYNPFTKNHVLNDDISVNYLIHCQRID